MHDWIAILDFGSQYSQLIARRIREMHVYCELVRFDTPAAELRSRHPRGIILSGGPASVRVAGSPDCDPGLFELGIPVLGICYGMQLMARKLGGKVQKGESREFGSAVIETTETGPLLGEGGERISVWMSHGDQVEVPPLGFRALARTRTCPIAAMEDPARRFFGLQFHPEVHHTPTGREMLARFVRDICGCSGDWRMSTFVE